MINKEYLSSLESSIDKCIEYVESRNYKKASLAVKSLGLYDNCESLPKFLYIDYKAALNDVKSSINKKECNNAKFNLKVMKGYIQQLKSELHKETSI